MPKRYSTARGREFGEGLRSAIANAGMTSRQLADVLGWQEAKLSDAVNGKGGVTILDIVLLLGACRTPESERERLLDLFPTRDLVGWWQPHGKHSPIRSPTARAHLAIAESLISWHPHAIPDLLQTTNHARAWLTASAAVPATEVDERLRALQELQEFLRNGVDCTFYIHEFALALQLGTRDDHVAQLQHLLLMANRVKIHIRIVPSAVGAHAGVAGPFTQLTFPKYQPLIWTQTENSSLFTEEKAAVDGYESVVKALNKISLNEDVSLRLISHFCVQLQESTGPDVTTHEDVDDPFPPQ